MGLNIALYEVTDITAHQFKRDERFDSLRYAGDEEFNGFMNEHGTGISCQRSFCCDWIFSRPEDFEQTRQWIKGNISEGNQERLLDVVNLMERESNRWLYFGW